MQTLCHNPKISNLHTFKMRKPFGIFKIAALMTTRTGHESIIQKLSTTLNFVDNFIAIYSFTYLY